jgi:cytidine deaminase
LTKVDRFFNLAREKALAGDTIRKYRLGAVGVRSDGATVTSRNLSTRVPEPKAHAESRLVKKLDCGSTVFVVRVLSDESLTMARPCAHCQKAMRGRGVKKCYYSINDNEFGVIRF